MPWISFSTPLGDVTLFEEEGVLISLDWGAVDGGDSSPLLEDARAQLDAYFDGDRQTFSLPLAPHGTAFQKKVWAALQQIPYGQTRSYGELAAELGSGPRAVGSACGRNPLPLLIPCHRVLGAKGALGGYSGADGVDAKKKLLCLEGVFAPDSAED